MGYVALTLQFRRYPEEGVWDAYCIELGTATFASTLEEAHEEIRELVGLHLATLEGLGERERFFSEHGIELLSHKPTQRSVVVPDDAPIFSQSVSRAFPLKAA
ncbi:type II toxin-antitoxin system HicB family antitoxin [bacterium]|nr:type II toxin-antitoxin system HicB family antitoxin [bacterium]